VKNIPVITFFVQRNQKIGSQAYKMMAVPSKHYNLGKESRGVFGKGYGFGAVKLDL